MREGFQSSVFHVHPGTRETVDLLPEHVRTLGCLPPRARTTKEHGDLAGLHVGELDRCSGSLANLLDAERDFGRQRAKVAVDGVRIEGGC